MDIIAKISEELGIKRHQTEAAVKLIDEGNTIPFIARYRKAVSYTHLSDRIFTLAFCRGNPQCEFLGNPVLNCVYLYHIR